MGSRFHWIQFKKYEEVKRNPNFKKKFLKARASNIFKNFEGMRHYHRLPAVGSFNWAHWRLSTSACCTLHLVHQPSTLKRDCTKRAFCKQLLVAKESDSAAISGVPAASEAAYVNAAKDGSWCEDVLIQEKGAFQQAKSTRLNNVFPDGWQLTDEIQLS